MSNTSLNPFLIELFQSLPVQYYQGFLTAPNNALAKDTSTMTGVAFHVTWDTSEREALQEHVRPTDSGPVPPQVAKVSQLFFNVHASFF